MDTNEEKISNQNNDSINERLSIANKKLAVQFIENEKNAAELIKANKELAIQNEDKDKRAAELTIKNAELKKVVEYNTEYIKGLEQMMYMTSYKIRIPVANIIGLTKLLEDLKSYPEDLDLYLNYIQQSATSLDEFTKELTVFIFNLGQKEQL